MEAEHMVDALALQSWCKGSYATFHQHPMIDEETVNPVVHFSYFSSHIYIDQAPQYLSDCVSTVSAASGRYRLRLTGSAVYVLPRTRTRCGECSYFTLVQPPGTLFLSTFTTLLTPVHSENDSRV